MIIVFDVDPARLRDHFFDEFCIDVSLAKMSFLMQNHLFFRSFLIEQLCKKALKSDVDDLKDRLEN